MKVNVEFLDEIKIKHGIRLGCILYPLLLNIYSEVIFEKVILHGHFGIKINKKYINNLRYTDCTISLAGTIAHLHKT